MKLPKMPNSDTHGVISIFPFRIKPAMLALGYNVEGANEAQDATKV